MLYRCIKFYTSTKIQILLQNIMRTMHIVPYITLYITLGKLYIYIYMIPF